MSVHLVVCPHEIGVNLEQHVNVNSLEEVKRVQILALVLDIFIKLRSHFLGDTEVKSEL